MRWASAILLLVACSRAPEDPPGVREATLTVAPDFETPTANAIDFDTGEVVGLQSGLPGGADLYISSVGVLTGSELLLVAPHQVDGIAELALAGEGGETTAGVSPEVGLGFSLRTRRGNDVRVLVTDLLRSPGGLITGVRIKWLREEYPAITLQVIEDTNGCPCNLAFSGISIDEASRRCDSRGACSIFAPVGTTQRLVASNPTVGTTFVGWGGACAGQAGTSCSLEVTGPTSVTGTFQITSCYCP